MKKQPQTALARATGIVKAAASGEIQQATADPVALSFPVIGKDQVWCLCVSKCLEYCNTYHPREKAWVWAQLKKARQWCIDNPTKRKTTKGMPRFLGTWLGRAADSSDSAPVSRAAAQAGSDSVAKDRRAKLRRDLDSRGLK